MPPETDKPVSADAGLSVLVLILRYHGIGVDLEQIRHRLGGARVGVPEMLRCAKDFGLRVRARTIDWHRLVKAPLPAILPLKNDNFLLIGKIVGDKALVQLAQSITDPDLYDPRGPRGGMGWPNRPDDPTGGVVGPRPAL